MTVERLTLIGIGISLFLSVIGMFAWLQASISDLGARFDKVEASIEATNARIDETNARIDALTTAVGELQAEIVRLGTEMERMETDIRADMERMETALRADIDALRADDTAGLDTPDRAGAALAERERAGDPEDAADNGARAAAGRTARRVEILPFDPPPGASRPPGAGVPARPAG